MFDEILETLKSIWIAEGIITNNGATEGELNNFENKFNVKLPIDLRNYFSKINGMPVGYLHGIARLWSLAEVRPLVEYLSPSSIPNAQEEAYISEFNKQLAPGWHHVIEPMQLRQGGKSDVSLNFLLPNAKDYFLFGDYNFEGSHWAIKLENSFESDNSILSVYVYTNVYHRVANSFQDFIAQYIAESPDILI